MQDILELMQKRYTTKHYDESRRVSDETMEKLLEVLRLSPSSVNCQLWHFYLVDSKSAIEKLLPAVPDFNIERFKAPQIIIFSVPTTVSEDYWDALYEQEKADGRFIGWTSPERPDALRRRSAEKLKDRIKGIIACAAGVDFLPMVWKHFFTDDIRNELQNGKVLGPSEETYGYCFSYEMFTQAEPYLLLNRKIHYTGPVILVHGDKDTVIPYQNSLKIKDALESKQVCVQIIKGEGHSLSGFPLERTLKFFIKQEE